MFMVPRTELRKDAFAIRGNHGVDIGPKAIFGILDEDGFFFSSYKNRNGPFLLIFFQSQVCFPFLRLISSGSTFWGSATTY
jgi:hypothetical protein